MCVPSTTLPVPLDLPLYAKTSPVILVLGEHTKEKFTLPMLGHYTFIPYKNTHTGHVYLSFTLTDVQFRTWLSSNRTVMF